jgi:alkylation response protein AidB-like acyl-CoA dehydrogenase
VDFQFTEEQQLIKDTARDFASRVLAPAAARRDAQELFPEEELKELGRLGLLGVNVPDSHGGSQAGVVAYVLAMMELAGACASTAVPVSVTNMVAETIMRFGSEAQKARHVPRLCSGQAICGAFALSEPAAGSDPAAMTTRAVKKGDRYLLTGAKQWISHGDRAGVMVVWAKTDPAAGARGITCFLVEKGAPGLSYGKREDKMGLRGSSTVQLAFDECEVPEENRLGAEGEGFRIALAALDGGRIGISSQALGIGRAALTAATAYVKDRRQFDQPLANFQAVQWMIADSATELDAGTLLTLRAARLKEQGRPYTQEASMAKVYSTEAGYRACNRAVQMLGGYGYIREFPVERYLRDVRVTTIYEGTSEIQRLVIGRNLTGRA